jgi:PAS domain S-box-containing protein
MAARRPSPVPRAEPGVHGLPSAEALPDIAEEPWWLAAEHLPIVLAVLDEELRIAAMNRALSPGLEPRDLVGRDALAFVDEAQRGGMREAWRRVLAGGPPETLVFHARRADGRQGWGSATATLVRFHGKPALLVAMMDITEMKEKEDALRASEAKWRSLVESAPEFILITDPERRVQFVNRVRSGREAGYLLGHAAEEFVAPEQRAMLIEHYRRVLEERTVVRYEMPVPQPDGSTVWYGASMGPIVRDGQVVGVISVSSDITPTKLVEASLRESEEKWRSLVEHSPDFIAIVDRDLRIQFLNRPGKGLALEDVVGHPVGEFTQPEHRGLQAEMYRRVFSTGQAVTYETPWQSPDGEVRWLQSRLGPVLRDGQVQQVVLVSTDITERRRAEEQARRSEARWRSLVENAPDTILIVDKELRLQFVNRLPPGTTLEQVRGLHVLEQVPEEFRAVLGEQYRRVFEERATVSYEIPGTGPDGKSLAWWRARMAPVVLDDGVAAAVVITTDITHRKRQEDLMREREALLAEAEHVANMGSFSLDLASGRMRWSEGMHRLFGLEPGSFEGTLDAMLARVHEADGERLRAGLLGEAAGNREYRFARADGAERIAHSRSQVVGEPGKRRRVGVVQDVTDLRRAERERAASEERARELQRLKDLDAFKTQFINTAAHELGTPLTPIRLQLDLLQTRGQALDERQRRGLAIVSRNVDRLAQLVQDVLEVARLQAGRLSLDVRPVEVQPLLADAVESFQEPARQSGVALELRAPAGLMVNGDARRLTQVVYNLLSNALKFTPRGGRIEVSAEREGGEVRFAVRDTGIGIRAEDLGKLFEPFSQVHDPSERAPHGTGLGLYISRGILELHGGRITAASPGLGQGATFTCALPAA